MRWTVSTEPLEKSPSERLSLLIPTNFTNVAVSKPANERAETDDLLTMPTYEPHEDIFFFSGPCSIQYAGIWWKSQVSKVLVSVSKMSLTVFQMCTCSYNSHLEVNLHWETVEDEEAEARCKVLSCAQDIAYGWVAERNGHLSTLDWEAPFIKLHGQKICHAFDKAGHILN